MAGRPQNRLELRRQYEAAEPPDPVEDEAEDLVDGYDDEDDEERKPKRKPKATKPKAKATKASKPAARMRVVWLVVNDAFKTIATFEFNQKEAALAKAAEMTAKGKGTHFLQRSKEAMPENAPGLGAAIPRDEKKLAAAAPKAAPIEEEEEAEIETEDEAPEEEFEEEDDEE